MEPLPKLLVVIASTRPGRVGPAIGAWFRGVAERHGAFAPEIADLGELDLPMFNEPGHPRAGRYEHEATRRWSGIVASADAFAFVTPEYDHSTPPSLANALIYLWNEWNYKPAGFVSYGGVSAGTRGVEATKGILNAMRCVPLPESVAIPGVNALVADGVFNAPEGLEGAASPMLAELRRWSDALRPLRAA